MMPLVAGNTLSSSVRQTDQWTCKLDTVTAARVRCIAIRYARATLLICTAKRSSDRVHVRTPIQDPAFPMLSPFHFRKQITIKRNFDFPRIYIDANRSKNMNLGISYNCGTLFPSVCIPNAETITYDLWYSAVSSGVDVVNRRPVIVAIVDRR